MNEKIKSILAKCSQESIDGPYANKYVDQAKFADLIIKECISCCEVVEKVEWIDPPTYELGVKACKVKIQTHFGVK